MTADVLVLLQKQRERGEGDTRGREQKEKERRVRMTKRLTGVKARVHTESERQTVSVWVF